MSNPQSSGLTDFAGAESAAETTRTENMKDDLDAHVLSCGCGNFPWDHWKERALAAGMPAELAVLGRAVMREAYQHAWSEELQAACGWEDEGNAMLVLALETPKLAFATWQNLLDTDGGRGYWNDKTGQWVSFY